MWQNTQNPSVLFFQNLSFLLLELDVEVDDVLLAALLRLVGNLPKDQVQPARTSDWNEEFAVPKNLSADKMTYIKVIAGA